MTKKLNTDTENLAKPLLANRLLKFNLFDIDRQQYFYDVLSLEKYAIKQWFALQERTSNNVIWLQFTGLIDINSKEIFEGDILELPNGTKGIVEWLESGFVLKLKDETIWQNLLFNVSNHYLKVGNIYKD